MGNRAHELGGSRRNMKLRLIMTDKSTHTGEVTRQRRHTHSQDPCPPGGTSAAATPGWSSAPASRAAAAPAPPPCVAPPPTAAPAPPHLQGAMRLTARREEGEVSISLNGGDCRHLPRAGKLVGDGHTHEESSVCLKQAAKAYICGCWLQLATVSSSLQHPPDTATSSPRGVLVAPVREAASSCCRRAFSLCSCAMAASRSSSLRTAVRWHGTD